MESAQNKLWAQVEGMKNIPIRVLQNWPAFFGFFGVSYGTAMALSLLPQVGGLPGVIESAAVQGAMRVVDHVAWESLKIA